MVNITYRKILFVVCGKKPTEETLQRQMIFNKQYCYDKKNLRESKKVFEYLYLSTIK